LLVVFLKLDGLDVRLKIVEGPRKIGRFEHHIVFAVIVPKHENLDCEVDSVQNFFLEHSDEGV
jgi:hypothetical protein